MRRVLAAAALAAVFVPGSARSTSSAVALVPLPAVLRAPVDVTAAPGQPDRLYVVEQNGLVLMLDGGRLRPKAFLDLRTEVLDKNLAGLLSIAFPRDYNRSRRVEVDYVGRDSAVHVVEYRSRGLRVVPSTARELLTVPMRTGGSDDHYGGQLAFGPDGLLYIGVGDGRTAAAAQDPAGLLGKVLKLDVKAANPQPEVVASGLRNPWRFSFDSATGDLFIGDVGADTWEELDEVPHGTKAPPNFGWPVYGGRARTGDATPLGPGRLSPPVLVYRHLGGRCSAIVGGYVYRGAALPALRGRYLYADFCSGTIWSTRVAHNRATDLRQEGFITTLLSSFGEDAHGELYVCAYTYKTSHIFALRQP